MLRRFKTQEEADSFFRYFYDKAYNDKSTESVILEIDLKSLEKILKIKGLAENYYRFYNLKKENSTTPDTPWVVEFTLKTLNEKIMMTLQYGAEQLLNHFKVFGNYKKNENQV